MPHINILKFIISFSLYLVKYSHLYFLNAFTRYFAVIPVKMPVIMPDTASMGA
ncbi:hypothetical protein EVA_13277 [gut metagenome]|uniref:Uncharacterized protein n=1 Tax=gut metagenome TaxID=749906 RepID=J9FUI2_9ZZZZ